MITQSYIPSGALGKYVDCIWVSKAQDLNLQSSHHAALFTELIFNYGDTFAMQGQTVESVEQHNSQQLLSGLKTTPFVTTVNGQHACVGFILKPFCYGKLQNNLDAGILKDLSELLYLNVYEPEIPDFESVVPYVLRLFEGLQLDMELQHFETFLASAIQGQSTLRGFSGRMSISQKSFIQKFKKQYIITPSQYTKLKQINYAIGLFRCSK